jgi:hypothetical protein
VPVAAAYLSLFGVHPERAPPTTGQQDKPVFDYGTVVPGMPDREGASGFSRDNGAVITPA